MLQLLITFAVFMILDNLQRLIWGVQPIFAAVPLQLLPNVTVFGVSYTSYQMVLLPGVAIADARSACATSCATRFPAPSSWR